MNFPKNTWFNVLYVNDTLITKSFYEWMGVEIQEFTTDKCVFSLWDFDFHCIQRDSEPWEEYRNIYQVNHSSSIFYIWVTDIDSFALDLQADWYTLTSPLRENWWWWKEILLLDPDGYSLAFYELIN